VSVRSGPVAGRRTDGTRSRLRFQAQPRSLASYLPLRSRRSEAGTRSMSHTLHRATLRERRTRAD
jgi:hypothetical protein